MATRIARAQVAIGAGTGAGVDLVLPAIEGQLIVPIRILLSLDFQTQGDAVIAGLSYQTDHPNPQAVSDLMEDPTVWHYATFDGGSLQDADLEPLKIDLAGPQRVLAFNEGAAARILGVLLYYNTRPVPEIQWANVKNRTSFEEV